MPVLKPNEAMIDDAVAHAARAASGWSRSFAPTLASMPAEFPPGVAVLPALAEGALAALDRGDTAAHDRPGRGARARAGGDQGCDVVALAQFSLARAAPAVRQRRRRCRC